MKEVGELIQNNSERKYLRNVTFNEQEIQYIPFGKKTRKH